MDVVPRQGHTVVIGQGTIRGDWPLPLTFAVAPVIGLVDLTGAGRCPPR